MDFGSYRDTQEFFEKKKSVDWLSWCCLNPFTKYVLPIFLACVILVLGVYFGLLAWLPSDLADFESQSTCHLQPSYYVPCLRAGNELDPDECLELGCCWRRDIAVCYHPFPSPYNYRVEDDSGEGKVIVSRRKRSPNGDAIRPKLGFSWTQVSEHHVRIALRTNVEKLARKTRKAKPTSSRKLEDFGGFFDFLPKDERARVEKLTSAGNSSIEVLVHREPNFSVSLRRVTEDEGSNGSLLLSTARGPLIVTEHYWEWTLYLTSGGIVYGLDSLELNGTSNWIYDNENATVKPGFVALDNRGNAMACLLDFSGPLEVQVLNGSNLLVLRGFSVPEEIGIELFAGPNGTQASQQMALAARNATSPRLLETKLYGLHVCPEIDGMKKLSPAEKALASLKSTVASMRELQAPWDSHCLYRKLGVLGLQQAELSEAEAKIIDEAKGVLREAGKSLASHLTPMLLNKPNDPLQSSLFRESCLLLNASNVYVGAYESRPVVYPSWSISRTRDLARESLDKYISVLSPDFIVLRDDWPKDESKSSRIKDTELDYLPEGLRSLMLRRTLPANLLENGAKHYHRHNAYSRNFVEFVGSSSAYVELRGRSCNVESVKASWESLRELLQAGIVESMMGSVPTAMYVCGAEDPQDRIDEELCDRWYGAAVVWPWILSLPEKSPGSSRLTKTTSRRIAEHLRLRASFSTYQHTVLASYFLTGFPIISTSQLHYPKEIQPRNTTVGQFFWGDSLLVGLVTDPKHKQVHMWLPGGHIWRHLHGGSAIDPTLNGSSVSVPVFDGQIITLLRPGRIVPLHETDSANPASNTAEAMSKNLLLLANLLCTDESMCQAEGRVYYGSKVNDGDFLLVRLDGTSRLTLKNVSKVKKLACGAASQSTVIESVVILGEGNASVKLDFCEYELENGDDKIELTLTIEKTEEPA